MTKKTTIKQQNKLKVKNNFKAWKYAKIMFIIVPVIFLLYTYMSIGYNSSNVSQIIVEKPAIIAGFAICLANLFMWYVMGKLLLFLETKTSIESVRFYIILMAISQLILLNYISLGFLVFGLIKYFNWGEFSFKVMLIEIKKDKQVGKIMLFSSCILVLILIELLCMNLKPIL